MAYSNCNTNSTTRIYVYKEIQEKQISQRIQIKWKKLNLTIVVTQSKSSYTNKTRINKDFVLFQLYIH